MRGRASLPSRGFAVATSLASRRHPSGQASHATTRTAKSTRMARIVREKGARRLPRSRLIRIRESALSTGVLDRPRGMADRWPFRFSFASTPPACESRRHAPPARPANAVHAAIALGSPCGQTSTWSRGSKRNRDAPWRAVQAVLRMAAIATHDGLRGDHRPLATVRRHRCDEGRHDGPARIKIPDRIRV